MELYLTVEIRNKQELASLIKAFFTCRKNGTGNLNFKDGKITMYLSSTELNELIEALCNCENITELSVDPIVKKQDERNICNLDAIDESLNSESEKDSTNVSEEDNTEKIIRAKKDVKPVHSNEKVNCYPTLSNLEDCPKAKDIISKSNSFEEAINGFSEWIDKEDLELKLWDYVTVMENIRKSNWKAMDLQLALKSSKKNLSHSAKIRFGKNIASKFYQEGFKIETIEFLKTLEKLRRIWEDKSTLPDPNATQKTNSPQFKGIFDKFPLECKYLLKNISNKRSEVKDKVYDLINYMRGRNDSDDTVNDLTAIISEAILKTTGCNENDVKKYFNEVVKADDRIKLSTFINNFLERCNLSQKVKVYEFVAQLKEIIA